VPQDIATPRINVITDIVVNDKLKKKTQSALEQHKKISSESHLKLSKKGGESSSISFTSPNKEGQD
jgi:hypothetical protein